MFQHKLGNTIHFDLAVSMQQNVEEQALGKSARMVWSWLL